MTPSIKNIAGYLKEEDAYRLISDLAATLSGRNSLDITCISWAEATAGEPTFSLIDRPTQADEAVTPPEGFAGDGSLAWALGAIVFYLVMGCHVFNGMGGHRQSPRSPLPYMRKSMPELSRMVISMLQYDPKMRPSLAEIKRTADKLINASVKHRTDKARPLKLKHNNGNSTSTAFWPEEFE